MLCWYYTVISFLRSSLVALERSASSAPSCLYEHMNYQERKGWLTLDFLKWRESQDESQTFTVTKRLCGCACVSMEGNPFSLKSLFFLFSLCHILAFFWLLFVWRKKNRHLMKYAGLSSFLADLVQWRALRDNGAYSDKTMYLYRNLRLFYIYIFSQYSSLF